MRAPAVTRLFWSGIALGAATVDLTAIWLKPSITGVGTHVALGLPPCGFLVWSGLPCPACGLTTSITWLAHGQLGPALQANPLGLPLFALAMILPPLAAFWAVEGYSISDVVDRFQLDRAALWLALSLMAAWAGKLLPWVR